MNATRQRLTKAWPRSTLHGVVGAVLLGAVVLCAASLSVPGALQPTPSAPAATLNPSPRREVDESDKGVVTRTSVPSPTPLSAATASAVDVVMTCFFASPGFYSTRREVPGLVWIQAFVLSLERHTAAGFPAIVVFFCDAGTAASISGVPRMAALMTRRFLQLIVVATPGNATQPAETAVHERAEWWSRPAFMASEWAAGIRNGANNYRFALFEMWLAQRSPSSPVRFVMFSDATDVAFQANPFVVCVANNKQLRTRDGAFGLAVVFTLEAGHKDFSNEKYNRRWMACYGAETVRRLAARRARISCAGVTFGTAAGIAAYARAQIAEISKPALVRCAADTIKAALDQATHNYLLHAAVHDHGTAVSATEGRGLGFEAVVGGHGVDACVWHGNFAKPRLQGETVVDPSTGAPFAVLHQFTSNRHPDVMRKVLAAYGLDSS